MKRDLTSKDSGRRPGSFDVQNLCTSGIGQQKNGVPQYFHGDWLGSTRTATDAAGIETGQRRYDAFGRLNDVTGSLFPSDFGFGGLLGYQMNIHEEVLRLIEQEPLAPEQKLPGGATEEQLAGFEARIGLTLPPELREWLSCCNGSLAGPGGLLGVRPDEPFLDIEDTYTRHPNWKVRGWIPVAADGCGSYYVLDTSATVGGTHPIYFLDHQDGFDRASYVAGSGIWPFLRFLLQQDRIPLDDIPNYWPFNKETVLAGDPALAEYKGAVPLGWEVK